jgi:hypothetical protein
MEKVKAEALRRVEALPKNWTNIKWTIYMAVKFGEIEYLRYKPIGRAAKFLGRYNRVWDMLGKYAEKVGIRLEYVPGPRGGRWTSKWVFKGLI